MVPPALCTEISSDLVLAFPKGSLRFRCRRTCACCGVSTCNSSDSWLWFSQARIQTRCIPSAVELGFFSENKCKKYASVERSNEERGGLLWHNPFTVSESSRRHNWHEVQALSEHVITHNGMPCPAQRTGFRMSPRGFM